MLKPAILYKDEIERKISEYNYTEEMFYMSGSPGENWMPNITDTDFGSFRWAIIDKNDKLIGYLGYDIYFYTGSVHNFGVFSFEKDSNILIGLALRQVIKEFQEKYHLHRMEWRMVGGNPIESHYDKLCEQFKGDKYCLHDALKDSSGNYRNSIIYEIIFDTKNGSQTKV